MQRSFYVFAAALVLVLLSACTKEFISDSPSNVRNESSTLNNNSIPAAQAGTTFTTVPFVALAHVEACLGYNIRFAGMVEMKTHRVVKDGDIQTYTRQWSIKGLTATSWSTGSPFTGGPLEVDGKVKIYEIKAGSEMFAVQDPATFNAIGTPLQPLATNVYIHQGTLVLQNINDPSDKLVIRHQIVKTPNTTTIMDMPRMGWYINGQQCGL